jgi:hypothetical protein
LGFEAGPNLQHFRLIEKIGEGGVGGVWRATDTTVAAGKTTIALTRFKGQYGALTNACHTRAARSAKDQSSKAPRRSAGCAARGTAGISTR